MTTLYTLRFEHGYNRLPFPGEVINTNKSLGWSTDPNETKVMVTYTPTNIKGEYLFYTCEIKRTSKSSTFQDKTPYEVVNLINSGYTHVCPGMKDQDTLSQFF